MFLADMIYRVQDFRPDFLHRIIFIWVTVLCLIFDTIVEGIHTTEKKSYCSY